VGEVPLVAAGAGGGGGGGLDAVGGLALGDAVGVDVGWTLGGRLITAAPGAVAPDAAGAGWLWATTGPMVDGRVRIADGLVAIARVRVDASPLDLDGTGTKLATWTTASVGVGYSR
jgi:hypothetical protein